MKIEQLEEITKQIEVAKSNKSKAEGAIEQINKQLKEEFNCDSVEEAKELVSNYDNQIDSLSKRLEKLLEEIENHVGNTERED